MDALADRAAIHAALGEPVRLGVVEELALTDRSPTELASRFEISPNLLAHHLAVLEDVGLIERFASAGDHRRRYVRLRRAPLAALGLAPGTPPGPVLFVCSHNSARSQLAAAIWEAHTGSLATSAGTHPAEQVHPGAVAAAARAGLDLSGAVPRLLEPRLDRGDDPGLVVTVCDRAHEELDPPPDWWHWSIPDPVEDGRDAAFDAVVEELDARIRTVAAPPATPQATTPHTATPHTASPDTTTNREASP